MVDLSQELHFGRLERVICWELDGQEEDAPLIRAVYRAHESALPEHHVVLVLWTGRAICRWVL